MQSDYTFIKIKMLFDYTFIKIKMLFDYTFIKINLFCPNIFCNFVAENNIFYD